MAKLLPPTSGSISLRGSAETTQCLGVKVTPVQKQSFNVEIVATGQIELLPNNRIKVTAPVKEKIRQLFVQPGATVRVSQALATMTSNELSDLRVAAQEKIVRVPELGRPLVSYPLIMPEASCPKALTNTVPVWLTASSNANKTNPNQVKASPTKLIV